MEQLYISCISGDDSDLILTAVDKPNHYPPHISIKVHYRNRDFYSVLVNRDQLELLREWLEQAEQLLLKEENK